MVPSVIMTLMSMALSLLAMLGTVAGGTAGMAAGVIIMLIVTMIIGAIIMGMYPLMTKDVLEGKDIDLGETFHAVVPRIGSLIGASILAGLIVAAGAALLIIPGIIFATWFYYTIPAVMLSGESATKSLSASKRFVEGKFWGTFLLLIVVVIVSMIIGLFQRVPYGIIIYVMLMIPVTAWVYTIPPYAYLKCPGEADERTEELAGPLS